MPTRAHLSDIADLTPDERLSALADIFAEALSRLPRPISADSPPMLPPPESSRNGLEVDATSRPDGPAAVDAAAKTERCP